MKPELIVPVVFVPDVSVFATGVSNDASTIGIRRLTGEETSAVSGGFVLPIAARPLDYMAVKFELLGGRKYVATIKELFFVTRDKGGSGDIIGWGGETIAEGLGYF